MKTNNYGLPEEINKQSLYNKVVKHLFDQKVPAMIGLRCVYRAPGGLACGIGCLIEDGNPIVWSTQSCNDQFIRQWDHRLIPYERLIRDLQIAHDEASTDPNYLNKLARRLLQTARAYNLNTIVLDQCIKDASIPIPEYIPHALPSLDTFN